MRNISAPAPSLTRRKLYIAVVAATQLMWAGQAQASPEGGNVVGGAGNIDQSGKETIIRQQTDRMAIDWKSFDVKADERVQFIQPGASSVALNRVISNKGSEILGRIDANGQVFLVNPNGVVFGKDSQINVGGILASGLSINPTDFMNGNFTLSEVEGAAGKVVNSGIINAATGGSVTLIGKEVTNDGLIIANLGAVNLAVGKEAVVTFDNSGLVGVKVTKEVLQSELGVDPALVNSGEINAEGGRILLTASTSQDIFSQAVNHEGMNASTSVVVNEDGSFTLGGGADVVNTGKISTSAVNSNAGQIIVVGDKVTNSGSIFADSETGNGGHIELNSKDTTILNQTASVSAKSVVNGKGGDVKILGDKVGLMDTASVNASGANGGGQVLIGGDETGKNKSINNANFIYLGENTNVKTDALLNGNGGKLITFAQDTARIYGNLYSRGGSESGDGGFIETSGLKGFEILNTPDISAQNGLGGTWLIDPFSITISGRATPATDIPLDSDIESPNKLFASSSTKSTIRNSIIEGALSGTGKVIIRTTGSLAAGNTTDTTGDIEITDNISYTSGSAVTATLRLEAQNDIKLIGGSRIESTGQAVLNVEFEADTDNNGKGGAIDLGTGTIKTNGGNFTSNSKGFDSENATIDTSSIGHFGGGDIDITSTGATNNVKLGVLKFGYGDQRTSGETTTLSRVGSVKVKSEGKIDLVKNLNFNNTGPRSRQGDKFTVDTGNKEAFLEFDADGDITIDGFISDGFYATNINNNDQYGDFRDALNITLISEGAVKISKTVYTAGGNFTATGATFDSSSVKIDTDRANANMDDHFPLASDRDPLDRSGNAEWSNGGNVSITASTSVDLGQITTDRNADDPLTVEGNLVIKKRNAADNLKVTSSSVLDIYGTTTFDLFGNGVGNADFAASAINFSNADNIFTGNILIASAGNVNLRNKAATSLGSSNIKGSLNLTSVGISNANGSNLVVDGAATLNSGSGAISLTNTANDFKNGLTIGSNGGVDIVDANGLLLNGFVVGGNAAAKVRAKSITFDNLSSASVTTNGGLIDLNATEGDLTVGAIKTDAATAGTITLAASGNILLNGNLSAVSSAGAGRKIELKNNVEINDAVVINTSGSSGNARGDVSFDGAINSATHENLTITGNTLALGGNVGGGTSNLGALLVNLTGNFSGGGRSINATSFDLSATDIYADALNSQGGLVDLTSTGTMYVKKINTSGTANGGEVVVVGGTQVTVDEIDTRGGSASPNGFVGGDITLGGQALTLGVLKSSGSDGATSDDLGGAAGLIQIAGGIIRLNGDIESKGGVGATPGALTKTLVTVNANNGSVTLGKSLSGYTSGLDLKTSNSAVTLNAQNIDNNWVIGATNTLNSNISFSGFSTLNGNEKIDTFAINSAFVGTINGGNGANIFNIAANVSEIKSGSGTDTFNITGDITTSIVDNSDGDSDTLNADKQIANTWQLNDSHAIEKLNNVTFSKIENLNGGDKKDTFTITGTRVGNIDAGGDEDTVKVSGNFIVDFSRSGIEGVQNAEVVESTATIGLLTVNSSNNDVVSWALADSGNIVSLGSNSIKFSGFKSFLGGLGNDNFKFIGAPYGSVDGAGGNNSVVIEQTIAPYTVELGSSADANLTLRRVSTVTGDANATLRFTDSASHTWNISDSNSGSVANTGSNPFLNFIGFSHLIGGEGVDIFRFSSLDSAITGSINGGSGTGVNEIVARGAVNNIWLMDSNSSGSIQQDAVAPDLPVEYVKKFVGIQKFTGAGNDTMSYANFTNGDAEVQIGSSTSGASGMTKFIGNGTLNSKITGLDKSSTWQLTAAGKGSVAPIDQSSPVVNFEGFTSAIGGSGNDIFNLTGDFAGIIRGGDGNDTFKFTAASTSDVYGGSGNDIFDIEATVGKLFGDAGGDTFNVSKTGVSATIDGGDDSDTLTGVTGVENIWVLTSANAGTLNKSSNTVYVSFESIQSLVGSESDSLTGINQSNRWTILDKNKGVLSATNNSNSINFAGMAKLIGGSESDFFDFSADNSAVTIGVDGGDTKDSSNVIKSHVNFADDWTMTGRTSGSLAQQDSTTPYIPLFENIQRREAAGDTVVTGYIDLSQDYDGSKEIKGTGTSGSIVIGFDLDSIWEITGPNSGTIIVGGSRITFSKFANITGGKRDDQFNFFSGGIISGDVIGGVNENTGAVNSIKGIADTANSWQMTSMVSSTSVTSGSVTAAGNTTPYVKFQNIQKLEGGNLTDTMYGIVADAAVTKQNWVLKGINQDNFFYIGNSSDHIRFTKIESIEGGVGANTLMNDAGPQTWEITDANHGKINSFIFSKINTIQGSGSDTLKGRDQANNWQLTSAKSGSVSEDITAPTDKLNFSGINKLIGGAGKDIFNIGKDGEIDEIDGGNSTNNLDNTIASKARGNSWVIENNGASKLYTIGASINPINFVNISNLTGGAGYQDDFRIANLSTINGLIDGGAGTNNNIDLTVLGTGVDVKVGIGASAVADVKIANITRVNANKINKNTLVAGNAENTFTITGENIGKLDDMDFEGFRNLTGGEHSDIFKFEGAIAKITGVIDGGTYSGSDSGLVIYVDELDLSVFEPDATVAMLNGTNLNASAINITNIESVIGNTSTSNTFIANNYDNNWSIDDINSGSVENESTATPIYFSNFKILSGGSKDDTFMFSDAGDVEGYIDGGDHETGDVVDLSKRTDKVEISLNSLADDGYRRVELFIGNKTNSILYGGNTGDTWNLTGVNSGNVNGTVSFSDFTDFVGGDGDDIFNLDQAESTGSIFNSLVGGAGKDVFNLIQGRLLGSVSGGADNDTFKIENAIVEKTIYGELGNDTLSATISASSAETTRFDGGEGINTLNVSGNAGLATHTSAAAGSGILRYDINDSIRSIRYVKTNTVNDSLVAGSLTIDGTEVADTFSLLDKSYFLNNFTTVNYANKSTVIVAGAADDQVLVNGKVNVAALTVKRASVATSSDGEIVAGELFLDGVLSAGTSDNRLKTNIGKLSVNTAAGDIYIQENDNLNISGFNSNNKFDLLLDGNLTSDVNLASIAEFRVETKTGNIILDKNNALTGEINLKAPGNITLNNSTPTKFGSLTSDTLIVDSLGAISSDGIVKVGGLATLSSGSDIVFENAQNDFNTVSIKNAQNVSLVDSGLLTLSTVGAIGDIKTQSQGIILNGAVNAGSLTINAGSGTANIANVVSTQAGVDITAQNIVVAGNLDAKGNVKATSAGELSQSAAISGANVEFNVGRYTTGLNVTTTATNGSVLINSASDITTKNISATTDIILKAANDLSAAGVLSTSNGLIDLLAGRNIVLNTDVNSHAGVNVTATNGSVQMQAALNSAAGDINVATSGDVVMGANAAASASEGNISYAGKNLTITALSAVNGEVTFNSAGSVNDANADLLNITAKKFTVDAAAGIGALDDIETNVSALSLASQTNSIRIINTGDVTIDRMRANSNIYLSNYKGDVLLDNSENPVFGKTEPDALLAGGTMNSNYNLSDLFIRIDSGDLLMAPGHNKSKEMPAIVANNAKIDIAGGNFGTLGAPIIVYVRGDFVYTASRYTKPLWAFGLAPKNPVKGPGVQTSLVDLLSAGAEQLVVVEEINQINPAIFTNVRNYVYDDIAIMLPADQRYDDDSLSGTN